MSIASDFNRATYLARIENLVLDREIEYYTDHIRGTVFFTTMYLCMFVVFKFNWFMVLWGAWSVLNIYKAFQHQKSMHCLKKNIKKNTVTLTSKGFLVFDINSEKIVLPYKEPFNKNFFKGNPYFAEKFDAEVQEVCK